MRAALAVMLPHCSWLCVVKALLPSKPRLENQKFKRRMVMRDLTLRYSRESTLPPLPSSPLPIASLFLGVEAAEDSSLAFNQTK